MATLLGRLVAAQRTDQVAADLPLDHLVRLLHAVDAKPPAAHLARQSPLRPA